MLITIRDAAQAPLDGLPLTWAIYFTPLCVTTTGPTITGVGGGTGQYTFDTPPPGYFGAIDCGVSAAARYVLYIPDVFPEVIAAFGEDGLLLENLTPTFTNCKELASGTPVSAPAVTELSGGFYQIELYEGAPITGQLYLGATSAPKYADWYSVFNPPPVVDNFLPADAIIARDVSVGFDVTDLDGIALEDVIVIVSMPSTYMYDIAFIDGAFSDSYSAGEVTVVSTTQLRFSNLCRRGGWPSAPTLIVRAYDNRGAH